MIVVDDGSIYGSSDSLEELGAVVVRYGKNRGKGYALKTGFKEAKSRGFERAITIDADGQHFPEEYLCSLPRPRLILTPCWLAAVI